MSFRFQIEQVTEIKSADLVLLDGILLEGHLSHGVEARVVSSRHSRLVRIKHVGFVDPPFPNKNRYSLSIEKPTFDAQDLTGEQLMGD